MPTLHLIPTPIAEQQQAYIDSALHDIICSIKVWCVEELRTARRFLKAVERTIDIDSLTFYVVNEHGSKELSNIAKHFAAGSDVGLLSEAGCPAVADPGEDVVAMAHDMKITVMPYVGPSSLMMALMGSGLNGNHFSYHAYLPAKNPERTKAIRMLADIAHSTGASQMFIEAPYRNNHVLQEIIATCAGTMRVCVACDIMLPTQYLLTQTVAEWKRTTVDLHKRPTVFVLGI
jgi:16S rRNA (cytidine1402-2'-O)-methyltransferase